MFAHSETEATLPTSCQSSFVALRAICLHWQYFVVGDPCPALGCAQASVVNKSSRSASRPLKQYAAVCDKLSSLPS